MTFLHRALVLAAVSAPLFAQEYAGPAILSRGEAPAAMAGVKIDFRPFLEVTGVYDTGLTGVAVNSQGDLGNTATFGEQFTAGISGTHSWQHTSVGLDYRGSLYHYNKTTYYDGADQTFMLGVTHQFTRHTKLALRESAGMFSRNFGLPGLPQTVPFDPGSSYVPTTDFFDNRTIYLSTQADFTWQKSARLSFNIGGDGFLARRRSSALYGATGGGARGDMQYRLSARSTVGAAYTYTHFEYRGVFSGTDLHGIAATYGVRLTRWWEFTGYGGFMRAETKFLQSVRVDPAIAALIGASTGAVIIHRIDYIPNVSGRLSRIFRRGVAYVSAGHTMTPGNGLFLTSATTSASTGYSYTGLRRWSFNIQAQYDRAKSLGNVLGYYGNISGTASASRQLRYGLHAIASFSARQYQSPDFTKYNRLIYSARLGLGFTPGDIPLRIW
jgi:hypothetical protein